MPGLGPSTTPSRRGRKGRFIRPWLAVRCDQNFGVPPINLLPKHYINYLEKLQKEKKETEKRLSKQMIGKAGNNQKYCSLVKGKILKPWLRTTTINRLFDKNSLLNAPVPPSGECYYNH